MGPTLPGAPDPKIANHSYTQSSAMCMGPLSFPRTYDSRKDRGNCRSGRLAPTISLLSPTNDGRGWPGSENQITFAPSSLTILSASSRKRSSPHSLIAYPPRMNPHHYVTFIDPVFRKELTPDSASSGAKDSNFSHGITGIPIWFRRRRESSGRCIRTDPAQLYLLEGLPLSAKP